MRARGPASAASIVSRRAVCSPRKHVARRTIDAIEGDDVFKDWVWRMIDRRRGFQEVTLATIEARHKAEARFAESAMGMRATAVELRRVAIEMMDCNDRALMLRLAAGYEQRADDALRRPSRPR